MQEITKTVAQSKVQQLQVVMPGHINTLGNLFGGQLLYWIDLVAGLVAFRHAGSHCTTASFDRADFLRPVYAKDVLVIEGRMVYVGNSSMEIRVDTWIERVDAVERVCELANRAYVTYVSIDEMGRPRRAPRLDLVSDEEWAEWRAGKERKKAREELRAKRSDISGGPSKFF
ncbi:acyl-CoA thioesterase [Synergistaceae bacterium OttesenSCG-928-I11]|nr:acyl-CoA thioesterase [Synergistaceae bacterium OttesenSCG-928-I11]